MSQTEPYIAVHRTSSGVKQGRPFAQKRNALRWAKLHGYNTIAQKKRGHAGLTIVQSVPKRKRKS